MISYKYCFGKVLLTPGLTADGYWSRKNKSDPQVFPVFPSESGQISELHNELQAILLTNEVSQ